MDNANKPLESDQHFDNAAAASGGGTNQPAPPSTSGIPTSTNDSNQNQIQTAPNNNAAAFGNTPMTMFQNSAAAAAAPPFQMVGMNGNATTAIQNNAAIFANAAALGNAIMAIAASTGGGGGAGNASLQPGAGIPQIGNNQVAAANPNHNANAILMAALASLAGGANAGAAGILPAPPPAPPPPPPDSNNNNGAAVLPAAVWASQAMQMAMQLAPHLAAAKGATAPAQQQSLNGTALQQQPSTTSTGVMMPQQVLVHGQNQQMVMTGQQQHLNAQPASPTANIPSNLASHSLQQVGNLKTGTQTDPAIPAVTSLGTPSNNGIVLYLEHDEVELSPYQCLVRKQIELFEEPGLYTGTGKEGATIQGRNRPVLPGQVGIRCRHCGSLRPTLRGRGAVLFPSTLLGVYQTAQNMANTHLVKTCKLIPAETRQKLLQIRTREQGRQTRKSAYGGGRQYWAESIRVFGVVETDQRRLRFEKSSLFQSNNNNGPKKDEDPENALKPPPN